MEENTTTQHGSESNTPHAPHSTRIGIGLVLGIAVLTLVLLQTVREPDAVGCTMEALVCPDGSAVGRQGPSCTFAPCPENPALAGTLVRDEFGVALLVAAPMGELRVPLVLRVSNALADFEGREVVARGTFTEGSTYEVASLERAADTDEEGGDVASDIQFVGLGEVASLGDLSVTLEGVVADNRCPSDVECIEGGAITARVTFNAGEEEKTFNMPSDEVPQEFAGYRVSITEVLPEALSTRTIDEGDYRVGFRIERIEGEARGAPESEEETPLTPNP